MCSANNEITSRSDLLRQLLLPAKQKFRLITCKSSDSHMANPVLLWSFVLCHNVTSSSTCEAPLPAYEDLVLIMRSIIIIMT